MTFSSDSINICNVMHCSCIGYLVIFHENYRALSRVTGWAKKPDHVWKCITPVYGVLRRRSIYQNVPLFIWSKTDILNVDIFRYSLHKIRETILNRRYPLIQAWRWIIAHSSLKVDNHRWLWTSVAPRQFNMSMSTVYPKHHRHSFYQSVWHSFYCVWLIRPSSVTGWASDDQRLGSLDDTIFIGKLSTVRN